MTLIKVILIRALMALLGLGIGLLALEGVFRLLPVHNGPNGAGITAENPVLRFYPERSYTYSVGASMSLCNEVRTNNFGFVSDIPYVQESTEPLLAVIGDSYVEALMVPTKESLGVRVRELLGDRRVYTFASSGAALSSYLGYAKYAREKFAPSSYVFVVVGNDFDESVFGVGAAGRSHYYHRQPDGSLRLQRSEVSVSPLRKFMRESALINYLFRNLKIGSLQSRIRDRLGSGEKRNREYVGNTPADTSNDRVEISKQVVQNFLLDVVTQTAVSPEKILFVVDGIRPNLYAPDGLKSSENSYFAVMRDYFMHEAGKLGFKVVDMQPVFIEDFAGNHKRFEFPEDAHWNSHAHQLVAEQIVKCVHGKAFC